MNELLDEIQPGSKKRPVFLTVTCILTWAGCIISLLAYGGSIWDEMRYGPDWSIAFVFLIFLSIFVSATGSIMMFIKDNRGFATYCIGQVFYAIGLVLLYILFGDNRLSVGALIFLSLLVLIPLGFILLYKSQSDYFERVDEVSDQNE